MSKAAKVGKEGFKMRKPKLPTGIDNFKKIRNGNYYYVDKTSLVEQILNNGSEVTLFTRPRRFGKSLNMSMIQHFFEIGTDPALFDGLKISKNTEICEQYMGKYPVISISLKGIDADSYEKARAQLIKTINREARRFQFLLESDKLSQVDKALFSELLTRNMEEDTITSSLQELTELLEVHYEQQVVVLIDEYDAPLLDSNSNIPLQQELRNELRKFFSPLKGLGQYLRFLFITGISKFSQMSIFSELNNLKNISMRDDFSAICGITERELLDELRPDIERMALANGETYEAACAHLKRQYDGYHFSKHCEDIYNPFSLFNAFDAKEYKNFWFSTGTPTFLIDLLQETDFDVRQLEGVEATDEQFDAPTERVTSPIPVLYQSGYLTIKGYDPEFQVYRLAYPNGEVRKGFIESLLPAYLELPGQSSTFYVVSFIRDLRKGDIESCLERTRSFFASIPNDLENKTEKHYQTIFYLLFRLMGMYVDSEVKSAVGRADVVIKMQDAIYVLEFKYDGTAREALAQINSRLYAVPYRKDGRRIVKVGINFDSATRTIGDWVIEVEDTVDNL